MRNSSKVRCAMFLAAALGLCARGLAEDLPKIPEPSIPKRTFAITDFGAVADGTTLNTAAIAKAVAACESAGGGTVDVPAGKFLTAAFSLGRNLDLHLERGATILLSNNFSDYKLERGGYPNQIVADHCHDVQISGEGTIDGQGGPWWDAYRKFRKGDSSAAGMGHRPFMVVLSDCTRVKVSGITLMNSPSFHLVPQACRDVVIDHVHFVAPSDSPNTDACDPSGWNFLIENCVFDIGDDCIAIKPGSRPSDKPTCEDFFVTDCQFNHGHGMSIGGQSGGGLRHLVVQNCTFDSTDAGIRMKSNRGVGGLVEDCTYENLTMKGVKVPIYITSYYPENRTPKAAKDDPAEPVNQSTPIWRNIRIKNVTITDSPVAGKIIGIAEMPISDIELDNVKIEAQKGMEIWNAKGIRFVNSSISVEEGNAVELQNASDVSGINLASGNAN